MASILVPLAQSCEELEAVTLIDLFRRAKFDVTSASLDGQLITASRGVILQADCSLDEALQKNYDMIVLPGGLPGADHLRDDQRIINCVQQIYAQGGYVAAICAAPRVLARAGLLEGKKATSYPGTLDEMDIPGMQYIDTPVIRDGQIITSRGPGTALDFALVLIEILGGTELRNSVEQALLRA